MTDDIALSAAFPDIDEASWRAEAERALKGKSPETLCRSTLEGLSVPELARESDFPSQTDPNGHPGHAPFVRGASGERDRYMPWDIRQRIIASDPESANAEALRDLSRGVTSLEVVIDPMGHQGVAASDEREFATLLDGVLCDIATVGLRQSADSEDLGHGAAALLALWAETADTPKESRLAFNLSPIGTLKRTGLIEMSLADAFLSTATLVSALALRFPNATTLDIDATPEHETGSGAVGELAGLIGEAIDTVRRLEEAGLSRDLSVDQMTFTLSVGPDYLREAAKLRAARQIWAMCLDALEVEPRPMRLQAVSSRRMLSKQDPWVNMLRITASTFAAGVGGADTVTALPFTEPLGPTSELGRRVARNTQLIAQAESHLGRVADPAGGAWVVERHARDLAEAAWTRIQAIERAGGYAAALVSGDVQAGIAKDRAELRRLVARREHPITGTSSFPTLDEIAPPLGDGQTTSTRASISADALNRLLPNRAGRTSEDVTEADPLWPIRLSEPFERLREAALKRGNRAVVLALTLGPLAEHTARLDFARNLFAAGGLALDPVARDAFAGTDHVVAVICGSNAAYADTAPEAARALKSAGVARVFLAGRPGAAEATLREAGVDDFVYMGCDVIDALERAHAELGLSS